MIYVVEVDAPTGAGSVTHHDTLQEALAGAIADCTYYLGNYPTVTVRIMEICAHCDRGQVPKARGFGYKKCPKCKGNHLGLVVTTEAKPHSNVKVIDNGTGCLHLHTPGV